MGHKVKKKAETERSMGAIYQDGLKEGLSRAATVVEQRYPKQKELAGLLRHMASCHGFTPR